MELLNFGNRESENFSLDLNQEDKSGFSPLVLAVYGGHTDVVVALTKRFELTTSKHFDLFLSGVDVNKLCTSGATAFNVALITGWLLQAKHGMVKVGLLDLFGHFLPFYGG